MRRTAMVSADSELSVVVDSLKIFGSSHCIDPPLYGPGGRRNTGAVGVDGVPPGGGVVSIREGCMTSGRA